MAFVAVCIGLFPFIVAEAAMRVLEVGSPADDVHDGFGAAPLFVQNEETHDWETNPTRQRFFFPQSFPADKPQNEFRIFILGGSTVQGRPFEPATSFGKWMELELNAIDPSRQYRVINCGGISYASYRLTSVAEEVLPHSPDAIVLATGHNEFLEDQTYKKLKQRSGFRLAIESAAKYSRVIMTVRNFAGGSAPVEPETDQPATEVDAKLDDEAGYAAYHRDEQWRRDVVTQFNDSVTKILNRCSGEDVPVIAVKLGANLRDCPPFKSEHRADLSAERQQEWQRHFDEATAAEAKDPAAALTSYRLAESIDDLHALLHFRIARCLERMGQPKAAAAPYTRALNEDICPLRMISETEAALVKICQEQSVALVDASAAVAAHCPDGIPGFDAYIDHVHPSIAAQQIVGSSLTEKFIEMNLVTPGVRLRHRDRRELYRQHFRTLPKQYAANGRRRIGWLENWARRQRLADEVSPVDGRGYVARVQRRVDLGDLSTASDDMLMAVAMDKSAGERLLRYSAKLFGQGRPDDAEWVLSQLNIPGLDESLNDSIELGRLVITLETGEADQISEALKQREDWPVVFHRDSFGWKDQMPDFSERLADRP